MRSGMDRYSSIYFSSLLRTVCVQADGVTISGSARRLFFCAWNSSSVRMPSLARSDNFLSSSARLGSESMDCWVGAPDEELCTEALPKLRPDMELGACVLDMDLWVSSSL